MKSHGLSYVFCSFFRPAHATKKGPAGAGPVEMETRHISALKKDGDFMWSLFKWATNMMLKMVVLLVVNSG